MALVTERVRENAKKCKQCVVQRVRDYIKYKNKMAGKGVFDKNTAEAFNKGAFVVAKFGCNLCPYQDDFKKVYGMTPAHFFAEEQVKLEKN
ncbi:MAG: hypothetical protein JW838_09945 [Spirochaetes bacterium]|nr:hypothetical protein [Spirochaetota bacterium]